ncbi:MAG: hypothetical protein V1912_10940 [bacterium]
MTAKPRRIRAPTVIRAAAAEGAAGVVSPAAHLVVEVAVAWPPQAVEEAVVEAPPVPMLRGLHAAPRTPSLRSPAV